tara:strand:+ start:385 stop:549 length:165 start_codon:yes stop_codon:yes gene_type:complete
MLERLPNGRLLYLPGQLTRDAALRRMAQYDAYVKANRDKVAADAQQLYCEMFGV